MPFIVNTKRQLRIFSISGISFFKTALQVSRCTKLLISFSLAFSVLGERLLEPITGSVYAKIIAYE